MIRQTVCRESPKYWAILRILTFSFSSSRIFSRTARLRCGRVIRILLCDFVDRQVQFLTESAILSFEPTLFSRCEIVGDEGSSEFAKLTRKLFEPILNLVKTRRKSRGTFRSQDSQRIGEEFTPFVGLADAITLDDRQAFRVPKRMLCKRVQDFVLIIVMKRRETMCRGRPDLPQTKEFLSLVRKLGHQSHPTGDPFFLVAEQRRDTSHRQVVVVDQ